MALEPDYAVQLNNYLQGYPSGNLTPYFQYVMTAESGPELQMAHHAAAKFHGTVIGRGRGFSKGAAKRDAARAAIQYIHKHGLPEPTGSDNSDDIQDLQDRLCHHPGGNLISRFSCSVPQTDPDHHRSHRANARCTIEGSGIGHGMGLSVDDTKQILPHRP